MPSLKLPPDLGDDVATALKWHADSKPARDFIALVKVEAAWKPTLPRRLIAVAHRAQVAVEGERLLLCVLCGFTGPQRMRHLQDAMKALRRAATDVAEGREAKLIYADGRTLLAFEEPSPRLPGWFDATAWPGLPPDNPRMPAITYPSPAGPAPAPAAPAPAAPAPATTPAPTSSRPMFPRGTVIERGSARRR